MKKGLLRFSLIALICLMASPQLLQPALAHPAAMADEIFVGFLSPTPEYLCAGEKTRQVDYYFINGVKDWLKKPGIPVGELSDTVVRFKAKLGKVSPPSVNLGGGMPVGGTKELAFKYTPPKTSGDESITVEVTIGSSKGSAVMEFPVDICKYRVNWSKTTSLNFPGVQVISIHSGDGEMEMRGDGSLKGTGNEKLWTSVLVNEIGCQEVAPREGQGTFEIEGNTNEDGDMQANLKLSSFQISAHRINCKDGYGGAPGATALAGTGKFNAAAGRASSTLAELNRARPITLPLVVIPRRQK